MDYLYRSLITLVYRMLLHFRYQPVNQWFQILVRTVDDPVRHVLPCDLDPVGFEFLLDTAEWHCIGILAIHDCGHK